MTIALHWFRRDLRLSDNSALAAACAENRSVLPVFVFDPKILQAPDTGSRRVAYLLECLRSLETSIEQAGGRLILRQGDVQEELLRLQQETGATRLYFNRDYEPYSRSRDRSVTQAFERLGVQVCSYKDGVIFEPHEILKADGTPYAVFTPYSRVWRSRLRPRMALKARFDTHRTDRDAASDRLLRIESTGVPSLSRLGFHVDIPITSYGEDAALTQLSRFVTTQAPHYDSRRNFPALNATSRLSPALRFGTVSPRQVLAAVEQVGNQGPDVRKETDTFVTELIWRDFYRSILWHYPHVAETAFKPVYQDLPWPNNEKFFQAWCDGRTGYPIVDAGMRELNSTGWMHNRVRMIVAAFLTKDLLVSWQWGERYFMQKLLDGDLSANNGGWQWSASTGTDAQPYFRIFNPTSQAVKFDPEGHYIRRFVPEVDLLSYPAPLVEHAVQREKALALFQRAKES